jgi:selenium metabolism protein YedF
MAEHTRGAVYLLNGECLGRGDDVLGAKLMATFLRTVGNVEPRPDAIVFYNAAIRLLASRSPHVEVLQALEHSGVDLLACVTCVEFFDLTDDLVVGSMSNMREICQRVALAHHTVTM